MFDANIIPTVSDVMQGLAATGRGILVRAPICGVFFGSVVGGKYHILRSPLRCSNSKRCSVG